MLDKLADFTRNDIVQAYFAFFAMAFISPQIVFADPVRFAFAALFSVWAIRRSSSPQ